MKRSQRSRTRPAKKPQPLVVPPPPDLGETTQEIRDLWAARVKNTIAIGAKLIKKKNELHHSQFEAWVKGQLPFSLSNAERFMAIASNAVLGKSANAPVLPEAWTVLYELSKIPEGKETALQEAIDSGEIAAKTSLKHARAFVARFRSPKDKPQTDAVKCALAERALKRIIDAIKAAEERKADLHLIDDKERPGWADQLGDAKETLDKLQNVLNDAPAAPGPRPPLFTPPPDGDSGEDAQAV